MTLGNWNVLTPLPFCLCPSDKIFWVSVERSPCLWTRQGFVGKRVWKEIPIFLQELTPFVMHYQRHYNVGGLLEYKAGWKLVERRKLPAPVSVCLCPPVRAAQQYKLVIILCYCTRQGAPDQYKLVNALYCSVSFRAHPLRVDILLLLQF